MVRRLNYHWHLRQVMAAHLNPDFRPERARIVDDT